MVDDYERLEFIQVRLQAKQGVYVYAPRATATENGVVNLLQVIQILEAVPEDLTTLNGQVVLYGNNIYRIVNDEMVLIIRGEEA